MKTRAVLLILMCLLPGCKEKPNPLPEPETFNYDNLSGKMAFSRSNGTIIILDGDNKKSAVLTTENKEYIWDASVSLSPDGRSIAYSSSSNEGYQVYKMSVNGTVYLKLTRSLSGFVEHYTSPVWSSDSETIFFVENGLIIYGAAYKIKSDGTQWDTITDFPVYRRVSVSKDNSFIAYSGPTDPVNNLQGIALYFIQEDSIFSIISYNDSYRAYSPSLSPDEKQIAYVLRHGPNEQGVPPYYYRIILINIDGTGEKLVKELPLVRYVNDTYVTWSPDGTRLAYNYGGETETDYGSHIFIINPDGSGLVQVTQNVDFDGAPSWIK